MNNKNSVSLMFVLAFAWLSNLYLAHAQSGLELFQAGYYPLSPQILEPLNVWAQIHNPDAVGHDYKVRVMFETYEQSQNGYVNAGEGDTVLFSFLPTNYGNFAITVYLWQDYYTLGPEIPEKILNVTVVKSSPWWAATTAEADSLNTRVQSLEAEISRLHSITNELTIGMVSLLIVTILAALMVWRVTKKRTENAMPARATKRLSVTS